MTTVANVRTWHGDYRDAVLIDRTTKWGNPFKAGQRAGAPVTRGTVIALFQSWWEAPAQAALRAQALVELRDKVLLCHCAPLACHGDIIAAFVNRETTS